ncbi:hypothetical protein BCR35DRAFT_351576 [Leucosporidium creatinivorum]|uniref:Uncharacterized protein n=1 Tax=Leucosporidium creatinivorum TaxID=106004 RepID=A0A1Y2FPV0_9BASI|nr:hypothetical protein BCR35DRAFT_351576 [Leucosporidium creatinivorum]
MCWSNATLFYGLWVTTASLNFAATAHKATRPTVLAIDLIISRRRRGKLEIEGQEEKTTARQLPEEVWELVKDELLGVEIRKAELDTLDALRCTFCTERDSGVYDCECCSLRPAQLVQMEDGHLWSRWGQPRCPDAACIEGVWRSGITWLRNKEQLSDISSLLSHHRLTLASEQMWHEDPKLFDEDFESLSAIAHPLQSTNAPSDTFPTVCADDIHNGEVTAKADAVFGLTPEALALPLDADHRFARLVFKYRLLLVDRTKSTICPIDETKDELPLLDQPVTSNPKLSGDDSSAKKDGQAPSLFAEGEPRWMLWSLAESCL